MKMRRKIKDCVRIEAKFKARTFGLRYDQVNSIQRRK
jgi:hypothetical protein